MKQEWKKQEKNLYLPKNKPEIIKVPAMKFFSITGQGNPNSPEFGNYIGVLYSLAYAVRMSNKSGRAPQDFFEYTVYPLEGVWDITGEAKKSYNGNINKDTLVFELMIRQPDFVMEEYAAETIEFVNKKKPDPLLPFVRYTKIDEGQCVQMLHIGSYDDESRSFKLMEKFATENNLKRKSMQHREIYLSDARNTQEDNLKTVLRFQVI